jgi:hypothetical protein
MAVLMTSAVTADTGNNHGSPGMPTDAYELYIGPLIEAYPGQDDLLIPLRVAVSEPTVGINVRLTFDASLLVPLIVAPNFFYQSFVVDLSEPGEILINLLTNVPAPPDVPPIEGDTIFAWIICCVTTEDPGYDVLTEMVFFEDPYTPYPDNSLLLENGGWITPPELVLTPGEILIISPLYGDININGFPYEIGDAVTFMNYFMGLTEFNARQYANSDCNRDGIQASIADLVYLLNEISGGRRLSDPPPEFPHKMELTYRNEDYEIDPKDVDNLSRYDIVVDGESLLGGAYFEIEYNPQEIEPAAVVLDSLAAPMELSCVASEGKLMIAVYNWNPEFSSFSSGRLFSVAGVDNGSSGCSGLSITRADFSDVAGMPSECDYYLECYCSGTSFEPVPEKASISCYPNPFNSSISISYSLPLSGNYNLTVYDILGRKVRTLVSGHLDAGEHIVVWDGTDESSRGVASGIYFTRLQGSETAMNVKIFMLK